jgi:AcrR family transcriptional regulator
MTVELETRLMRRAPMQRRSTERVDRMLDVCAMLLDQVGYEALTTKAIAEKAGVSIGSVYQYFPDKEAILQALAARYLKQLHEVHERVMTPETAKLPLPEVYDRVIGALADFHRRNPGFRPLFFGSPTSAGLAEAAALLHEECIGRAEMMIAAHAAELPPKRRRLLATINVEVMKALLPLSEAGDEKHRRAVLGEIKKLLLGHMERVMAEGA